MPVIEINLPEAVKHGLSSFVEAAQAALGETLRSVVLFGSAAEGKLRKTSDVNVIVVLSRFEVERIDRLREPLRTAHAAIKLDAMFLLEQEIAAAVEAFAVKFADIRHRHRVLFGTDVFADVAPSRSAELARLDQALLNTILRLRRGYLLRSLRDEQVGAFVADVTGPIRACAEALLELQGTPAASPKEALAQFASQLPGAGWRDVVDHLSEVRETGALPPGVGPVILLRLIELATLLRSAAVALRGGAAA
jgi:predicted nucleotidyltransferase